MQSDAMNRDLTLFWTVNTDPHGAKGVKSRQAVLALQKTGDRGDAFGQGAEHDRTVGNGFVARDAQSAL
jgi:hypothetical protein